MRTSNGSGLQRSRDTPDGPDGEVCTDEDAMPPGEAGRGSITNREVSDGVSLIQTDARDLEREG